jgi:hypothetical protein
MSVTTPSRVSSRHPPISKLGLRILRSDLLDVCSNISGLTITLRELAHSQSTSHSSSVSRMESTNLHATVQNTDPIYRELEDSAASIVTEILKRPLLIIDALVFAKDINNSSAITQVGVRVRVREYNISSRFP